MPYQIDRFNGIPFSVVPDQTVDSTSCDLKLIGKNYAGYGEVQNENFLYLLENFRGLGAPRRPVIGQLWYDETANKIKYRDLTNNWRSLTVTEIGEIPPTSLVQRDAGNLWYDSANEQINVWDGTEFVVIGPEVSTGFPNTKLTSTTIRDNGNTQHPIIKMFINDSVVATISGDEYAIGEIDTITGFSRIKKGITLVNTNITGETTTDFRFWGTASDSDRLAGYDVSSFVLRSGAGSTFDDLGLFIGTGNDLKLFIEEGNRPVISNQVGTDIKIRIVDGSEEIDYIFDDTALYPFDDEQQNLGSSESKWNVIYSREVRSDLFGNVTGNLTGNSVGIHRGNIQASDLTVAYNSTTKTFTGTLTGNVTGNVTGNLIASDATTAYNSTTKIFTGSLTGNLIASDTTTSYNAATKTFTGSFNGNSLTTDALSTARRINGVLFDGTQDITLDVTGKLATSGGTLTGFLTLHDTPVNAFHAANKKFVEDYVAEYVSEKPLVFSLDIRGLTYSEISTLLNTLAPVTNYQPLQQARIAGTIQSVTSNTSTTRGSWISVSYVNSVSVTTTVNNPTRNNDLVFQVNSSRTSWEYVSG